MSFHRFYYKITTKFLLKFMKLKEVGCTTFENFSTTLYKIKNIFNLKN